jgi:hypothetical protein
MTADEIAKAKHAARRLWCSGDANGKHDMRRAVIDGKWLGHRCHKCGFESKPKKTEP